MMRLFYDANFAVDNHRGMGRYINTFIDVLSLEFNIQCTGLLKQNKIKKGFRNFGFNNYILWEQFSLVKLIKRDKPEIMVYPYNTAPLFMPKCQKNILIVHDLIFLVPFKEIGVSTSLLQNIGKIYRRIVVPRAIKQCDVIITVSEHTKNEIIKVYNPKQKIIVIPNSVNFSKISHEIKEGIAKSILHIGGEAPHKNTSSVIKAYALLPIEIQKSYDLKIVGIQSERSRNYFKNLINELNIKGVVFLYEFLSEDEIVKIFRSAKVFVFASYYEGFGIPLIEAMHYNIPIVCSNRSVIPEIVGKGGLYFEPDDILEQSLKIQTVITNEKICSQLINSQQELMNKYKLITVKEQIKQFVINELKMLNC